MDRLFGFSTGSVAFGDFRRGLDILRRNELRAVEISALREPELEPLVRSFAQMDLSGFSYISIHAPSKLRTLTEQCVIELITPIIEGGVPVVVHAD